MWCRVIRIMVRRWCDLVTSPFTNVVRACTVSRACVHVTGHKMCCVRARHRSQNMLRACTSRPTSVTCSHKCHTARAAYMRPPQPQGVALATLHRWGIFSMPWGHFTEVKRAPARVTGETALSVPVRRVASGIHGSAAAMACRSVAACVRARTVKAAMLDGASLPLEVAVGSTTISLSSSSPLAFSA